MAASAMRLYARRRWCSSEMYSVGMRMSRPEIERGMHLQRRFFAFQLMHGLFQQADVHVEADRADVSVLLAAQDIARAAQLQIERGDFETRAEIAEFLKGGQALACDLAQLGVWREPANTRTRGDSTVPRGPRNWYSSDKP